MKFSLSLLVHELDETIISVHLADPDNVPKVVGMKMLDPATTELQKDYLYLGRLPQFQRFFGEGEKPAGCTLIFYGTDPNDLDESYNAVNYLVVTPLVPLNRFINLLETVFATYYEWENRLLFMSISAFSSLQEMLDTAYEKIKIPMCMLDINHAVQALVKEEASEDSLLKIMENGYGYRFVSVIQDCNPSLEELDRNDVTEVISNISGNRLRVSTIRSHGRPAFYLGLHKEDSEPFENYTLELFGLLTDMFKQKAMSVPLENLTRISLFGQFISDLISGTSLEENLIDRVMEYFGFSDYSGYILIGIDFPSSEGRYNVRLAEFIRSIEREIQVCKCFYIQPYLGILIPKDKLDVTESALKSLIKDYKMNCAASNAFSNINDISGVWNQVLFMLACPDPVPGNTFLRRYDHYIIKSCSAAVEKRFPIETLYNQVFLTLKDFDRENQTEYVKTLVTFLQNNCSITDTAAKLFIHRNSMRYRIQKIEELVGFDITESEKRELILFTSFFVNDSENSL
ncbi:MAG: helix-turn-helix domain-containing protein [Eubacterium sp.]|nr:helix-turn-helix domain-containing protein [Eubacterium sp.]